MVPKQYKSAVYLHKKNEKRFQEIRKIKLHENGENMKIIYKNIKIVILKKTIFH